MHHVKIVRAGGVGTRVSGCLDRSGEGTWPGCPSE